MTRRFFGFLGALAGVALVSGSCVEDPLSNLDGTPAAVITDYSSLQFTQGVGQTAVTASVVDGRSTPLALPVTAAACDAAVTVERDTTYHPVPETSARFIVRGISPAASCVNITAGGITKAVPVIILATAFGGTVSPTTVKPWDTLTVNATTTLRFDPATSQVDFGNGNLGVIVTRTATQLRVVVPVTDTPQPAPLTIINVDVTYQAGLRVNLPTTTTVTNTNPYGVHTTPLAGPAVTVPDTILEGFANGTVDHFYTLTLTGSTTFTATLDWPGGADVDLLFCTSTCTLAAHYVNTDGATTANPETATATLGAGTYNVYINNFTPEVPVPIYRLIITP